MHFFFNLQQQTTKNMFQHRCIIFSIHMSKEFNLFIEHHFSMVEIMYSHWLKKVKLNNNKQRRRKKKQ